MYLGERMMCTDILEYYQYSYQTLLMWTYSCMIKKQQ